MERTEVESVAYSVIPSGPTFPSRSLCTVSRPSPVCAKNSKVDVGSLPGSLDGVSQVLADARDVDCGELSGEVLPRLHDDPGIARWGAGRGAERGRLKQV